MEIIKRAGVLGVAGAFSATATAALAQVGDITERYRGYGHGHDMMWGNSQWGGFGMILGPIFMILSIVAIVAGVIYLLRLSDGLPAGGNHAAHDRALALLKERYAKGEIDSDEFAERKKLLAE